jgi:hypothetical protein
MDIKLLPYTSKATVAIGSVGAVSITTVGRALLPCPPGNVKVNGVVWPDGCTFTGDVTLTWAHRNRQAQVGRQVMHQDSASVDGGQLGTYKVEVLMGGVVVRTVEDITAASYLYTLANCNADGGAGQWIKFRITPCFNEIEGNSRLTDQFRMV